MQLRVNLLHPDAFLPKYGSEGAAGMDLSAYLPTYSLTLPPGERAIVPTGISIELPTNNMYARVAPRSGLAARMGIDVLAGVIDSDYRGEIGVVLVNHGHVDFEITHGDRIAQLIIERILHPEIVQVGALSETQRGSGGFGSTGV